MPIPNSGVARSLARLIVDELRRARSQFRPSGELHVFAAIPVGLAVLIGQLTNTLGPITVYEHVESGNVGTYTPGVRLT